MAEEEDRWNDMKTPTSAILGGWMVAVKTRKVESYSLKCLALFEMTHLRSDGAQRTIRVSGHPEPQLLELEGRIEKKVDLPCDFRLAVPWRQFASTVTADDQEAGRDTTVVAAHG